MEVLVGMVGHKPLSLGVEAVAQGVLVAAATVVIH